MHGLVVLIACHIMSVGVCVVVYVHHMSTTMCVNFRRPFSTASNFCDKSHGERVCVCLCPVCVRDTERDSVCVCVLCVCVIQRVTVFPSMCSPDNVCTSECVIDAHLGR